MSFILGQQLVRQKEFGKALNIFLNLEKKTLKDSKIYFYLGMINFELNNFDKSIFYYEKFLQNVPNSISALHNLAIVKQSTGDIDVAPRALLHVDAIEPDGEGADVGALGAAVEQNRVDMDVPDHHEGVRLGVPLVCRGLVQLLHAVCNIDERFNAVRHIWHSGCGHGRNNLM